MKYNEASRLQPEKAKIRTYLQHISQEALWTLCAMAKDGDIVFVDSCKCIRGIVGGGTDQGYQAECSPAAIAAEEALNRIGVYCTDDKSPESQDRYRNARILPIIRAEMKRRDRIRNEHVDVGQGPVPASLEVPAV